MQSSAISLPHLLSRLQGAGCLLLLTLAACQRTPAPKPIAEYQMHGEVLSVDPSAQIAKIKHDKIEGWMEAMTMEYPVKSKQEFEKLRVGQTINAKIDVQGTDYWIDTVAPGATIPTPASAPAASK